MVSRRAGEARKQDIGAAAGETSRVRCTLARGRLDDVFYPRPDTACVRALRLFVDGAPADEHEHACARPHERVPLLEIETRGAAYAMTKETIAEPRSNAVLQRVRWRAPVGRLRVLLEPELAVVEAGPLDHHGHLVIAADLGRFAVAVAASAPWASSEGHAWHDQLRYPPAGPLGVRSVCVRKTLEARDGGRVAALAKPWGPSRPGRAWGSYHLVWPRDLVASMGAMLAAGAHDEARQALTYLNVTQRPDGHWPQNMKLDGRRVWKGNELDETALPILLVDLLRRERLLDDRALARPSATLARAHGRR